MEATTSKRASAVLALGILAAVAWLAWVFLKRTARDRAHEEAARTRLEERYRPYAAEDFEELRILHFYASPPKLKAGGEGLLCYGVQGAVSVEISNLDPEVKPTRNRCLTISPAATTTYSLAIEGTEPASRAAASLTVLVEPERD